MNKDIIKNAINSVPGNEFYREMLTFLLRPAIYDGMHEYAPLKNPLGNLVKSIIAAGVIVTFIKYLMQGYSIVADIELVINPFVLYLSLFVRAIITAVFFGLGICFITWLTDRKRTFLYTLQVIQAWSLMNLMIIALFWIALHRIFVTGTSLIATSNNDLIAGLILSTIVFILIFKTVLSPVYFHLKRVLHVRYPLMALISGLLFVALSNLYFFTGLSS